MSNYITEDDVPLGYSSEPDECESEERHRIDLNFPAAVRIDNVSEDVSEEDIFYHFRSCGDIRYVVKTGYAAYIQFATSSSVAEALKLQMILNGDPYMLTRISADDWIDHIQVIETMKGFQAIENMKNIKYRKPFVMVENYPELPTGAPCCEYKSKFEAVGPVRHLKIAPTAGGTVTLALCMDKEVDRNMVIERYNDAVISGKRLKVYVTSDKARMTVAHVVRYAICENSITVEGIRPDYEDYDVCMLFRKCGSISFLEKFGSRWIICFDHPSAVFEARSFHVFSLYKKALVIKSFNQQTFLAEQAVQRENPYGHGRPPDESTIRFGRASILEKQVFGYHQHATNIQQNLLHTAGVVPTNAPTKQPIVGRTWAIPRAVQPKPSTSQTTKRTGNARDKAPSRKEFFKLLYTFSNLPKGIEDNDLRELFRNSEMKHISMFCSKDLYHPTAIAYVKLTKAVTLHPKDLYRGKRICIRYTKYSSTMDTFGPEKSIMLKNLSKDVSEEDITEELHKIPGLKVTDVVKPAHHYAYVDFAEDVKIDEQLLNSLRNALTCFKSDVFTLYSKIPACWLNIRSFDIPPIDNMREVCGAVLKERATGAEKEFAVRNAHKLFVGNIPRDTKAEDVIDYFNNFGSVIDYAPIEKKSCCLRKSVILSFVNSKHAQNAYCQQPHFLEGSVLDVHLMDCSQLQFAEFVQPNLVTVKSHSPFLTNDEIHHALLKFTSIKHGIRFDASDDRTNYVAVATFRLRKQTKELDAVLNMQYINDEAVKIVLGYDPTPPTEDEACEKENISNSPHRQQKENYLNCVVNKENLKEGMEVRSKPIMEVDIPFKSFYNDNSVQINNVSVDTTLEDIRDLFVKCGDIVDYRTLLLDEDATKICYVMFKIDLAADLACTYSQRMVNGKRILVHLAKETLHAERDRSVLVEKLSPSTTAEHLHDAFAPIAVVKYVQKQSPCSAIVCFKDKDSMLEAIKVTEIPNSSSFVINPCCEEYDPRFFNNFSCQEESIPIDRMQAALKARILPEFHQLELERQVFATLPADIKTRLTNELFVARQKLPNFNVLSRDQQIDALKTKYQDFTQREHFLRLTVNEQKKLLHEVSNMPQDYSNEGRKDQELLPPAAKQTRKEERTSNASHVAQALPTSGLQGFPRIIEPYPPQFAGRMPPFGDPYQSGTATGRR